RLKPATAAHGKRFVAIHQWFSAIPARRTEAEGAPLTPAALLSLPPAGFHRVADQAQIEDLGLTPREVEGNADIARVVLYGRVRWSVVPEGESSMLEVVSNELEMVTLTPGLPARVTLQLDPELPAACFRIDLALLRAEQAQAAGAQEGRAAGPQKSVAPMSAKHRAMEKRRASRPV